MQSSKFTSENHIHEAIRYWMQYKLRFYKFLECFNEDISQYGERDIRNLESSFIALCFQAKLMHDDNLFVKIRHLYPELIEDLHFYVSLYNKIISTIKKELKKEFKCPSTNLIDLFNILNS